MVKIIKEEGALEDKDDNIAYLLSFLMILVHRNGGKLIIENLNDFEDRQISLNMELKIDENKVILKTEEVPHTIQ